MAGSPCISGQARGEEGCIVRNADSPAFRVVVVPRRELVSWDRWNRVFDHLLRGTCWERSLRKEAGQGREKDSMIG